jgi:tetratricopeptide (TPR) repeat protein
MKRHLPAMMAGVLAVAMTLAGCGGAAGLKGEGVADTPEGNYQRGMTLLEKGDLDGAQSAFDRAVALDPKFAPGYEGLALVNMEQGDYKIATKHAKKCISLDKKYGLGYVAYGRILARQEKYDKAHDKFKDALKNDSKCKEAHFWAGETYKTQELYGQAATSYKAALDIDNTYRQANDAWKELQKSERAMAGLPAEYRKIAMAKMVTRADVAAILVTEVKITDFMKVAPEKSEGHKAPQGVMGKRKSAEQEGPTDIAGNWAEDFIKQVVDCGAMDLLPSGAFEPGAGLDRASFSVLATRILARATGKADLESQYIGNDSHISDVDSTSFYFNAAMVVTTRGILSLKLDGTFDPTGPVSGNDALLALKSLKAVLGGK